MKSFRYLALKLSLVIITGLAVAFWMQPTTVYAQGPTLEVSMDFGSGATVLNVESGVQFTYFINYRCASALNDCGSTTVTDVLPAELQFISTAAPPNHMDSVDFDAGTNTVTFNFVDPLPAGSTGVLEIRAMFPPGTIPGTSVVNNATSSTTGGTVTTNDTTATAEGQFEMYAEKTDNGDVSNGVVGNFNTTYLLRICSPDSEGGVRLLNPEVTDPLPSGATYISSTPAGNYDAGTNTVTWTYASNGGTLPDVIDVGGCYNIELVVHLDGNAGDTIDNTFSVTGDPEDGTTLTNPLTDTYSITLQAPTSSSSFSKTSTSPSTYDDRGTEELPGGEVTYNISYANTGTVTHTNVIITDTVPPSHTITSITVNPVIDPVNAFYELNNSGTWVAFPGNAYNIATTVTITDLGVAGDQITGIRWELGTVPYGAPGWTGGFVATLDSTLAASTTLTNCADLGAVNANDSSSFTLNDCASVTIIDNAGRAIPRPAKAVDSGPYLPGEVMDITLTASNDVVAHNAVDGPIILADLLPPGLEIVVLDSDGYRPALITDTWYTLVIDDGATAPTATLTYSGTQMLAQWEWGSSYHQQPGHSVEVQFKARIKDGTPPQTLQNRALLMWGDTTVNPLQCEGGQVYTDTLDLDGDGNTTETGCQTSPQPIQVNVFLAMDSEKFVWGQLDTDWNKLGWTVPGGNVDWKMVVTNTSNVSTTHLVIYDILPYVGDTGVIATNENRGSIWRPNMQAPVNAPAGVPLTISYSQSQNPCRTEVVPSGPAGCVDDWSTTFPGDAASVQAIKLDFCDSSGTNCLVLDADDGSGNGGVVTFTWHMVAPNGAPRGASNIAWNSFGFTAEGGGIQLLPAEPIRVGTRITDTLTPYELGDYVWLDVAGQQNDGIQQPEEQGINGVRVELYDADTDTLLDYRFTGPDHNGNPGYYLFTDLPAANYYLRFFTPMSSTLPYTFSIANNGSDDALDSDGETPGVDSTYGPYLQTASFALGPDTLDWDQGLWLPTDYGDAPQGNNNYNYPVVAATQPISAALAGRHIISPTIYLGNSVDAELDGQQSADAFGDDTAATPDDEDGVQFENYLGTVAQPTGVMVIGRNHTLVITATSPFTTSYLNAWIDFNGDGDWDDAGEQIATDDSRSGMYNLTVNVPAGAVPGTTYARFRYSTQQGLTPYLTAPDGEVEDYRVILVNPPEKSLVATSEAHTGGVDLAIGEIARYRLVVPIPEGTLNNFVITDNLPAGLQFMDDGTVTASFTGTSVTSTTFTISGGPFGDGTDPVFSLGTVTNNDADTDEEDVIVEFNALVLNTVGNNNGDSLDNSFTVTYDTFSATSNVVTVNIVEPDFNITKSVTTTPNDVGDTVVYQIDVTGAVTTAFDLVVSDTLVSDLTLGNVSATAPAYATTDTSNTNIGGNYVEVGIDELRPGDTATILVTATVQTAVPVGQTIPNTATLAYSSLPLTGTVGNPTGSNTPGDTGDTDGERNGTGGINDHNDVDRVDIDLLQPSILKTVNPTEYTIGDLITYTMRITLPEGTTRDLVVVDDIPAGQAYQTSEVISTVVASDGDLTNDFNGTLPVPTVTAPGGDGADVTFDFGDTDTVEDNDGSNNTFLIRVTTAVLDASGNRDGLSIDNIANLNYTRNSNTETISTTAAITIAEPVLHIGKTYVTPAACSATLYLENFNDGSADGGWNSTNAWTVNNGIYGTNNSGLSAVGDTAWTDYSYSFMMRTTDADGQMGAYIRQQGGTGNEGYRFRWTNTTMVLERRQTGNAQTLATHSGGYEPNHWYHVEMRAIGNTIEVYVDGVLVLSGTDDVFANGRVGFYDANLNPIQFDDVLVTKMDDMGCYIGANELVTYTLFISNQWTLPGYNLVITDDLPISSTLVSYTFSSDDATASVTSGPSAGDTGTVTWDVTQLTNESPFTGLDHPGINITVVVRVDDGVPANTVLPSQVWLAYDNQPGTGPIGIERDYSGGSHSTALRTVDAGLAKTVTFSPQPTATLGSLVTYTIVAPSSPITATLYGVVITDQLQSPRYFIENVTASGGTNPAATFDQTSGLITATFDSILHDTQATITVTARISHEFPSAATDPNSGDVITNTASMSHTTGVTESNVVSTDVHEPLLQISKSAVANAGDPRVMDYTVTVTNIGDADAFSLNVTDRTPDGTTASNISDSGTLLADGHTISWTIASLAVGASRDLTYQLTLNQAIYATNLFTNTAIVTNTSLTSTIPGVRPYVTDTVHTFPLPMGRIGDYVWLDADYDGVQGSVPPEQPIGGVLVNLYDDAGNFITSTTTAADGSYIFQYLPLNTTYVVQLDTSNFGAGGVLEPYTTTVLNAGGDTATDSDADANAMFLGNGYAITTTLTTAITEDLTLDYGFTSLMSLGNQVWYDQNDNGILNALEVGIANVAVELYQDTNGDGVYSSGDTLLDTTTTTASGYYTFTNLYPGDYVVVITGTNFIGTGALVDYLPSSPIPDGGNDDVNNHNHGAATGTLGAGGYVASTVTTLVADTEPTNDGDTDANSNLTIDFGFVQMDLGDLPDGYGTTLTSNGARHLILPSDNPTLGATVDAESDGQPSVSADGDDLNGTPDDEDGVMWASLALGQTVPFTVTASSETAYLNAWIDFNGDGDFADTGEQIATDVILSAGVNTLSVSIPATATTSGLYMRFRYSSISGLTPTGAASDGEVEDYLAAVVAYDLGDLPDQLQGAPSYPTLLANGGARHLISPTLYLGNLVDAEGDGQPTLNADGDDNTGAIDDEDGVTWTPLALGQTATFTVTTASADQGYLNAWIDFNGNGTLDDAGEQIISGASLNSGANTFAVTIPATATSDSLYMRFRYSTLQTLLPTGDAPNGEVEDYVAQTTWHDLGDLPDIYGTTLASTGARHVIDPTLYLGDRVDAEGDGQPSADALGDDSNATTTFGTTGNDDEDGVSWTPLNLGQSAVFTVTSASSGQGFLNGWIDFNGDGDFADAGEQVVTDTSLGTGTLTTSITIPMTATTGNLYMRFRYSTQAGLSPTGDAPDGEVEDYVGRVVVRDWGDLPEGPYPVTAANNGARHIILATNNPTLGATVDDETDGQPNATATGDDTAATDDEDGVQLMTPLVAGQVATFTITATNTNGARLIAWMDFNGDGDFADAGETIFNGISLSDGANVLTITVPSIVLSDTINSRFRYSTDNVSEPTGEAADGEVEDYQFESTRQVSLGDLVWFDYNNNGIFDSGAGESGVSGVTVELYNSTDTPGTDTPVATVTTDGNGRYLFSDIPEGGYIVHIPPSQFVAGQPLYGYDSTVPTQTDPNTDQNEDVDENGTPVSGTADVAGVSTGVVTVTVGMEPQGDDVANIDPTTPDASSNLTVDFGFYPANAGITVVKTVETSPNVHNATVRYTITVTNSGQLELFPVVLTDTLPAELTYVAGTASPAEPDTVSGQTLVWDNIVTTPLLPGQSTQVGFDAQITAGYTGTFINVVTGTGVYTGGTVTDDDSVPIEVRDPSVDLMKNIVPPGAVNGVITYTIRITNTGPSELDVVPLFDYYDPTYLDFTVSTPPEDYRASGEIRWNDLTQSFGRNLLPGEQFVVTTTFAVINEITQTVNRAVVSGTTDIYVNPAPPITDTATITNTPTAVDLLYFTGEQVGNTAELRWATASETDNYAFFVYRGESANRDDAVEISGGIAAKGVGGAGAEYTFTDDTVSAGTTYHYWLADMDTTGTLTWHPPIELTITAGGDTGANFTNRIYLPLIVK